MSRLCSFAEGGRYATYGKKRGWADLFEVQSEASFDVLIMGAGLAGLTLARQLVMQDSSLRICLVHNRRFPNAEKIHKVGESSVEMGAFYLSQTVGCEMHLKTHHLDKMGLRFIQKDGEDYREIGIPVFPHQPTYQIDRGKLENYLHDTIKRHVTLFEGYKVLDTEKEDGVFQTSLRDQDGKTSRVSSRFVVDASGRSRILMRKFGLQRKTGIRHSAIWFRVAGRVDINEFFSSEDEGNPFRKSKDRSSSTTHLVGRGYWVWIIRINSQTTSIGIVFDDTIHDLSKMCTHSFAMSWLKVHEPRFAAYMDEKAFAVLDFGMMRNYSYVSERFLSSDGWALTGEAAGFVDPMYSNGTDLIGLNNTMIKNIICGKNSQSDIDRMNTIISDIYNGFISTHIESYEKFDSWAYVFIKTNWDALYYFCSVCFVSVNGKFHDPALVEARYQEIEKMSGLHERVMSFLRGPEFRGDDYDIRRFVSLVGSAQDYANRVLVMEDSSQEAFAERMVSNVKFLSELADAITETRDFDHVFFDMGKRYLATLPLLETV